MYFLIGEKTKLQKYVILLTQPKNYVVFLRNTVCILEVCLKFVQQDQYQGTVKSDTGALVFENI